MGGSRLYCKIALIQAGAIFLTLSMGRWQGWLVFPRLFRRCAARPRL